MYTFFHILRLGLGFKPRDGRFPSLDPILLIHVQTPINFPIFITTEASVGLCSTHYISGLSREIESIGYKDRHVRDSLQDGFT